MKTAIVWFRQDLRLADNPALYHAAKQADKLVLLYIYAPNEAAPWQPGSAKCWWLHHSLLSLQSSLHTHHAQLVIRKGNSLEILLDVIRQSGARDIHFNQIYEPGLVRRDKTITKKLQQHNIHTHIYNGLLLHEPDMLRNKSDSVYRVFTPFWNTLRHSGINESILPSPRISCAQHLRSDKVEDLHLLPTTPWDEGLRNTWVAGEQQAFKQLHYFLDNPLSHYSETRDSPGTSGTSRLSPYLANGEISPRQIWVEVQHYMMTNPQERVVRQGEAFLRQIAWREFSYYILHHFPQLPNQAIDARFADFSWQREQTVQRAWQKGLTGFPLIDAGMRELWHSGWMHNRVRMVAASLFCKNALQPWRDGARWFWDTLVDADLACNSFNWQWVAGCGMDAAPYFRVFNPITQAKKFDPDGRYIQQWVSELGDNHEANVTNFDTYPPPILDLKASRIAALKRYKSQIRSPEPA